MRKNWVLLILALLLGTGVFLAESIAEPGAQSDDESKVKAATKTMKPEDVMRLLEGKWHGTSKVWTEPGKLFDDSPVRGTFKPILGGNLMRHEYEGKMKGKPRNGEETIAFNPGEGLYQISWFDSFHMPRGILFSKGAGTAMGFSVKGNWRVAPGQAPWGWRTDFTFIDDDHLTMTAYVITPDGEEAKGVETVYDRVK